MRYQDGTPNINPVDPENGFDFSWAYACAVCDGDVATIPIPSTVLLLFSGITGIFFIRRRSKTGTQISINRHKFLNLERCQ